MFNDFTEYTHIERAERAFDAEERHARRERHDDDAIEGRAEAAAAPAPFFSAPRPEMPGYTQIANGVYAPAAERNAHVHPAFAPALTAAVSVSVSDLARSLRAAAKPDAPRYVSIGNGLFVRTRARKNTRRAA